MTALAEKIPDDFAVARRNMVESQLRPNRITDARLLEAIETLPREDFLPSTAASRAYIDEDVAVAPGRFMMEPTVLARLIQELEIAPTDRVLEIGCNTGYGAAILSRLSTEVWAIDSDQALILTAAERALREGYTYRAFCAPLAQGLPEHGPFNAILVHGAVTRVPEAWGAQLTEGGRMAVVVTEGNAAALVGKVRLYRKAGSILTFLTLCDVNIKFLPGFEPRAQFVF
ncbi:MAG: protein-L-isoaspartate O-methyltransferase [Alphaproteobacteria bacterium]